MVLREFATEFPIGRAITRAQFLAQVVAWLRGKKESIVLDGFSEADLEGASPRLEAPNGEVLTFRELELDDHFFVGFRHDTPDGEKNWRTEAVYAHSSKSGHGVMRIRVQCLAVKGFPELLGPVNT